MCNLKLECRDGSWLFCLGLEGPIDDLDFIPSEDACSTPPIPTSVADCGTGSTVISRTGDGVYSLARECVDGSWLSCKGLDASLSDIDLTSLIPPEDACSTSLTSIAPAMTDAMTAAADATRSDGASSNSSAGVSTGAAALLMSACTLAATAFAL